MSVGVTGVGEREMKIARSVAWAILVMRLAVLDPLELLRARSINDYASFHAASAAIRHGFDPYSAVDLPAVAKAVELPHPHPYFYPPLLAELLLPLTWFQAFAARMIWHFGSALSFFACLALLQRWLDRRLDGPRAELAKTGLMIMACSMWALRSTHFMGQVNAYVLLAIVGWWTERDRRPNLAAALLGLAAAIKMSPALLLLVPLTQRRWRELLVSGATGAGLVLGSCLVIGERGLRFFSEVLLGFLPGRQYHGLGVPIDIGGNHSLGALAFWLFDRPRRLPPLHLSPEAARFHAAVVLVLLLGWLVVSLRRATPEGSTAALMVLMVVAPTYAFEHHVSFTLLPVACVMVLLVEGGLGDPPQTKGSTLLRRAGFLLTLAALALLTPHEADLLPPPRVKPWLVMLSHMPKLLPLLTLFLLALVPRQTSATVASAPASRSA